MMAAPLPGLRGQALRGFFVVGLQRAVSLGVAAVGGILLARLLGPEVFGLYAVLAFAVGIASTVGDLGLGAALIQRQALDAETSLPVAFTAQMGLAVFLAVLLFCLAPFVPIWFHISKEITRPLRLMAFLIPLSALRMPLTVMLERRLAYRPLAVSDSADTLVYYGTAVAAALGGAGIWSLAVGAVLGRTVGLATLWRTARRWPAIRWDLTAFAAMIRFGGMFQATALLNALRDAIVPTFIVAWSGVAAAGFLTWASAVAFLPLHVVSMAGRVLFPALATLQHDPPAFAEAVQRAVNRVAMILYPVAAILLVGAEAIVRPVYGDQWMPAVPAVRWFAVAAALGGTSTLLVQALYSLGRADVVFRLNLLWMLLLWGLAVLLVPALGFVGFALASAAVSTTVVLSVMALRRSVPVRILPTLRVPLGAALVAAIVFRILIDVGSAGLPWLLLSVGVAVGIAAGSAWLLGGQGWRSELKADWSRFRERPL
jgi:O-antigen/teichoic acid export membrane protein